MRRCLALLSISAIAWSVVVRAEPPRDRSLVYDPARKTWVERPTPEPGTPEGDLRLIRQDIKDGRSGRALKRVEQFAEAHGESHRLYPAVLIARAEARIERRDYDTAHAELQSFLDAYAGMAEVADALRLEFVVAEAYLGGAKRRVLGVPLLSGEDVAFRILDEISTGYPESALAPLAIKTKADYLFARGEHDLAEFEFARLLRNHPTHRYHQFALRQSARSALASFRGIEYDEAALIEAEERFDEYAIRYPAAARHEGVPRIIDGIEASRAAKDYEIGRYYERTDHLASAIYYYRIVVAEWPGTLAADQARERLMLLGAVEAPTTPPVESAPDPATGEEVDG